jgi:hypothetical protein
MQCHVAEAARESRRRRRTRALVFKQVSCDVAGAGAPGTLGIQLVQAAVGSAGRYVGPHPAWGAVDGTDAAAVQLAPQRVGEASDGALRAAVDPWMECTASQVQRRRYWLELGSHAFQIVF